jgi:hypothetical protein
MYGLADRIVRSDTRVEIDPAEGALVPLFPHTGVLVLEPESSTMTDLVRACVGAACAVVTAQHAGSALLELPTARPGVVVIDLGVDPAEVELLADGLAAAGLDAIPLIMLDPIEPINAAALRGRVLAALHVSRRVWFGGGLRSRVAA